MPPPLCPWYLRRIQGGALGLSSSPSRPTEIPQEKKLSPPTGKIPDYAPAWYISTYINLHKFKINSEALPHLKVN